MSTTTEEETTVTITSAAGTTGPVPMSELDEALARPHVEAALDGARERLRSDRHVQMGFELVGGNEASRHVLKLSTDVRIEQALKKGAQVQVRISDARGELLVSGEALILGVNFKDEYKDGYIVGTDRIVTAKL